jgi:hypothetical protein
VTHEPDIRLQSESLHELQEEIDGEGEAEREVMPFKKAGPNTYKSPSGRTFTKKQVALYYATDGFTKKPAGKKSK